MTARTAHALNRVQFADLSEYGYGVAILSESKYGFSCQGNILRISLLRAATAPDAEQDQGVCLSVCLSDAAPANEPTFNDVFFFLGKHSFAWAVLPHASHFLDSEVPMAAYLFNSPMHGGSSFHVHS